MREANKKITQERGLEPVDAGGNAGGAEAVINVDDGDVGRAGIEHAEKRRDAAKAGAVADAGRNGDDRGGDQPTYHTGKRALHSSNANDHAGLG